MSRGSVPGFRTQALVSRHQEVHRAAPVLFQIARLCEFSTYLTRAFRFEIGPYMGQEQDTC